MAGSGPAHAVEAECHGGWSVIPKPMKPDRAISRHAQVVPLIDPGTAVTMEDRYGMIDKHSSDGFTWTRVGTVDDIPRLGSRVVRTRGEDIAVFRTSDDRVFAMHDRCPHKQGKLSQGIVHGTSVTCPLHNWVIGLDDGAAKDPDEGCVRTVPVKLEGRDILLAIVA
jgi:nitrite reductase (NADH) small subunit